MEVPRQGPCRSEEWYAVFILVQRTTLSLEYIDLATGAEGSSRRYDKVRQF